MVGMILGIGFSEWGTIFWRQKEERALLAKFNNHLLHRVTPPQILAFGFACIILLGTFLLQLPISTEEDQCAVSAVAVADCHSVERG